MLESMHDIHLHTDTLLHDIHKKQSYYMFIMQFSLRGWFLKVQQTAL